MELKGPFPTKDADFNTYIITAIAYLVAHLARLGVSTDNRDALLALLGDPATDDTWLSIYPLSQDSNTRTKTITKRKNDLRKAIEDELRVVYDDIPESALITEDRNTLHLPERDTEPTRVPVPGHAPDVEIEKVEHLKVTLRLTNPEDPDTKAKPHGVKATQVFIFIGTEEPASNADYSYYGETGKFLFEVIHPDTDVNKTMWIIGRYVNTRGEVGPFSRDESTGLI